MTPRPPPTARPTWLLLPGAKVVPASGAKAKGGTARYTCREGDAAWESVSAVPERKELTVAGKADYVKRQGQTRDHTCHWPGCPKQVPPAMWGCKDHWFRLPKSLRDRIWQTYQPGQEITMDVSQAYLEAARDVQEWIRSQSEEPQP